MSWIQQGQMPLTWAPSTLPSPLPTKSTSISKQHSNIEAQGSRDPQEPACLPLLDLQELPRIWAAGTTKDSHRHGLLTMRAQHACKCVQHTHSQMEKTHEHPEQFPRVPPSPVFSAVPLRSEFRTWKLPIQMNLLLQTRGWMEIIE